MSQLSEMNEEVCNQCKSDKILSCEYETVCCECGLVQNTFISSSNVPFETQDNYGTLKKRQNYSNGSSKLKKMQEWYKWTNEEKNEYKLVNYTKALCNKLNINEALKSAVCSTVVEVMNVIKKHDGTKRARVKDGIILVCAQYASKNVTQYISAFDLARQIKLDTKYITKAEKIILELVASKKLNLNMQLLLETQRPYDYVLAVVQKQSLQIPDVILKRVQQLIDICEKNDLLLDHTPLSIGVCCFYYMLKMNEIEFDTKLFSKSYDLSVVTVVKTYNKLKQYDEFIIKHLQ